MGVTEATLTIDISEVRCTVAYIHYSVKYPLLKWSLE